MKPRASKFVFPVSRQRLWEVLEYEPHRGNTSAGSQWLYHDSKARFRVAACGRRYGKSRMCGTDAVMDMFVEKGRMWLVADTYSNGEDEFTVIDDAITKLCDYFSQMTGSRVKVKSRAYNVKTGDMHIEMPWGALVEVKSGRYPNTITGKGIRRAIMCEAAKIEPFVWEKHVRPALADWRGRADFVSTPEGNNWFKSCYDDGQGTTRWEWKPETGFTFPDQELGAKRLERGQPWEDSWESWNLPAWENPIVYPGGFFDPEIQAQMKTPEGTPFFWQEIGARFDVFVGSIYPQFDPAVHLLGEGQEWWKGEKTA